MSSIEPDNSGCEVDGGEEISGGFVVARGDSSELFEFAEEILDQVARLVELGIENRGGYQEFRARWAVGPIRP